MVFKVLLSIIYQIRKKVKHVKSLRDHVPGHIRIMAQIKQEKQQKENSIGTYLGVDFGKSKIGLAIADEETKIAFSFDTLKNDGEFWKNIQKICQCERVKTIVVGTPSYEINQDGAEAVKKFAKKMKKEIGVRVELENEMFTTKMAQAGLKEKGEKNVAKKDDSAAARIILQSWLDRQIR